MCAWHVTLGCDVPCPVSNITITFVVDVTTNMRRLAATTTGVNVGFNIATTSASVRREH